MQRPAISIERRAASRSIPGRTDTVPRGLRGADRCHARRGFPRAAVMVPPLVIVPLLIVLLIVRRASGALAQPLPAPGLMASGLILAAWAVLARDALGKRFAPNRDWRDPGLWLPPAVLLVACLALLLPGSPAIGVWGLMGILAAEEAATWGLRRRSGPFSRPPSTGLETGTPPARVAPAADDSTEEVIAEIVRRREENGAEAIRGWTRVELAAGQRTAPVHVAFCPALAGMPRCEAEQSAGPAASVRVAQVLPYGARFEVKLEQPASEPVSVEIEFSAIAAADVATSE